MYLIAEIGVNFYDVAKKYNISPMDACKLMIVEAKNSGAHCVKFQSYKADTLTLKDAPAYWDLTKEPCSNQHDLFKKNDSFNEEDFKQLYLFCKKIEIDFLSTPFDVNSANYLDKYQDKYKISSSDITNFQLLKTVASKKKPVLLSTGASDINEIKRAVNFLEKNGCPKVIIMHCILNYPTPNEDANLNMIKDIKKHFPSYELGYSDHTRPDEKMIILTGAYLLGAKYIEKHFTLDKSLEGNDHYHSADPSDFKIFTDNIKLLNICGGSEEKKCIDSEVKSKLNARRSIVTIRKIKKGDIFTEDNISCKRPGTGLCASRFYEVIGRTSHDNVENDTLLKHIEKIHIVNV